MARYTYIDDRSGIEETVDTAWADESWQADIRPYGRETLHRIPSMGAWYLEIEDPVASIRVVSPEEAADWLREHDETVPRFLADELGLPLETCERGCDDEIVAEILGGR